MLRHVGQVTTERAGTLGQLRKLQRADGEGA